MLYKHILKGKISQTDSAFGVHAQWQANQRVRFEVYDEDFSGWENYTDTIIAKRWNKEIEECIYGIEVTTDYDTGEPKYAKACFSNI